MADANIKKVVIPKAQLPSLLKTPMFDSTTSENALPTHNTTYGYNVRYRIISEDKNRTSHWSKIYNIDGKDQVPVVNLGYSYVKETVTTSTGTNTALRINWEIPITLGTNTFDIFVKKNGGSYSYYGTSYTNTYVVTRSASLETSITILVQTPTYPKAVTTGAKLFETAAITVP
jgi:hypothetical protein